MVVSGSVQAVDFVIQVLVFGVVGVLSEAVRRHAVALADGGPAPAVGRYDNTNGRSVRRLAAPL